MFWDQSMIDQSSESEFSYLAEICCHEMPSVLSTLQQNSHHVRRAVYLAALVSIIMRIRNASTPSKRQASTSKPTAEVPFGACLFPRHFMR